MVNAAAKINAAANINAAATILIFEIPPLLILIFISIITRF